MYILDLCDNGDVLSVIRIVNIVLTIIRVSVPIILILSLMIGYMGAVKSNDADALAKMNKLAVKRVIAAVLVFLIPNFIYVLVEIVDPGNRTYFSCMNDATKENINAAYRLTTEKYIDIARESLKKTDYNIALQAFYKVKSESDIQELQAELDDLKVYIDIRERIIKLGNDFDKNEYNKLKDEINALDDEEIKAKLQDLLKENIGHGISLSQFNLDPNAEIYRNLQNLSGKTLSAVLSEHGSNIGELNSKLSAAVTAAGIGTREAPAVAALTLIETLANYGYRINYDWGGKWDHIGIDGNMGKRITPYYCDSHPSPDWCKSEFIYKGFDCSGFVNWALVQGFQDEKHTIYVVDGIPLAGKIEAICDVGDVIVNNRHITLVVGKDDAKKSYIVAESTGVGLKLSYYNYNNSDYNCRHLEYLD